MPDCLESAAVEPDPLRAGGVPSAIRVALVCPVLDDWESFLRLLRELAASCAGTGTTLDVIAVDDGSAERLDWDRLDLPSGGAVASLEVIRLGLNLGHQRAIAIGLVEAAARDDAAGAVVMDSDGEDRPADVAALIALGRRHPGTIVFARRAERSEGLFFKAFYRVYKMLFQLLTGRRISFGNFCFLPAAALPRLSLMPELWNNLAAAIMRSRLPWVTLPTSRGQRYAGDSKMALVSLIAHGLSAISVYADVIFVRLLIAAVLTAGVTLLGIAVSVFLRFATDLAIPGWTTTVVGFMVVILMQAGILVVIAALQVLSGRSSRPIVPRTDCRVFIESTERRDVALRPDARRSR